MFIRDVLKVENRIHPLGYHLVLVKVLVNGKKFWECYVGVDSSHPYFSTFEYTEELDARYSNVQKHAFEDYGSVKYFNSYSEVIKMQPIDGAWLSYARFTSNTMSSISEEGYEFLQKGYFYYGAGFLLRDDNLNCTDDNCYSAAVTQLDRIAKYLENPIPVIHSKNYFNNELIEIVNKSEIANKIFWYANTKGEKISKHVSELVILPYEFDSKTNSKIWEIGDTDYFITGLDGSIFKRKIGKMFDSEEELDLALKEDNNGKF